MTVDHVEVLVEELSMEAALEWLLPKMLPDVSFRVHTHQGKLDLLGKLPEKLKAYSRWILQPGRSWSSWTETTTIVKISRRNLKMLPREPASRLGRRQRRKHATLS